MEFFFSTAARGDAKKIGYRLGMWWGVFESVAPRGRLEAIVNDAAEKI